jgi:hypothetical protein
MKICEVTLSLNEKVTFDPGFSTQICLQHCSFEDENNMSLFKGIIFKNKE